MLPGAEKTGYRALATEGSYCWSVRLPNGEVIIAKSRSHIRKRVRHWATEHRRNVIGISWATEDGVEDEDFEPCAR